MSLTLVEAISLLEPPAGWDSPAYDIACRNAADHAKATVDNNDRMALLKAGFRKRKELFPQN